MPVGTAALIVTLGGLSGMRRNEILGQSLKGIGIQLGVLSGLEDVTERYVDVRIARKRTMLEKYHRAVVQVKNKEERER